MLQFLLLCLLLLEANGRHTERFIPGMLQYKDGTKKSAYLVTMTIGNPSLRLRLSVDFSTNRFVVFKDIFSRSNSDSEYVTKEDVIYIGGDKLRIPIIYDPLRSLPESIKAPIDCDGVFGLDIGSFIWLLWTEITFSPGMLQLGKPHDSFFEEKTSAIECIYNPLSDGLCETNAILFDKEYRLVFTFESVTKLPPEAYTMYTNGKNIFLDEVINWEPLTIRIFNNDTFPQTDIDYSFKILNRDIQKMQLYYDIVLEGEDLVSSFGGKKKFLLIEPNSYSNDTIILGINAWRNFILHKSHPFGFIFIRDYVVHSHVSIVNLFLFLFMFWVYIRWKMSRLPDMRTIDTKEEDKQASLIKWMHVDFIYHTSGVIVALVVYNSEPVREILSEELLLDCFTGITLLLYTISGIFTEVYTVSLELERKRYFRLMAIRSLAIESILLTGMWLTLVERRLDGVSTFPTAFVMLILVYNTSYHCLTLIFFNLYSKYYNNMKYSPFFYYSFLYVPMLLVLYILISYFYFVLPLARQYAMPLLQELTALFITFSYTVVFTVSLYTVRLYIRKGILKEFNKKTN